MHAPKVSEKVVSAASGVEQEKKLPQNSNSPKSGLKLRYTDIVTPVGVQRSMPILKPESGVVAVLQMPAKPVYTDELPTETVHCGSVKISTMMARAKL